MDKKALYNLSYGVFVLTTKSGDVVNGCITNTCMQVANSPTRVAIAVINTNYTCDLIKESGVFALSILDETCMFPTISHFGFQSGRDVNKFENLQAPTDVNGIPYIGWQTCAVISCKVVSKEDLGSHTLFIAEVVDAKLLNQKAPLTYADSVKTYCWGQDMFADMFSEIQQATDSVYVETFIIHNDKTGKKLMELLCQKAKEGLEVKLLYDDAGSISTPKGFFYQLDMAGGETQPFFPVKWKLPLSVNFRNHRKITVIDNKIAYMGGINIGDEYANCSENKRKPLWRDTHVRLTGECVLALRSVFYIDWFTTPTWKIQQKKLQDVSNYFVQDTSKLYPYQNNIDTIKTLEEKIFDNNSIPVQVITAGPDDKFTSEIEDALIRMIMNAKKYVYIQTPYFTPDVQFYNALKIAVFSGVDVRIMVPKCWDKFYVKAAAFQNIRELLQCGIKFYHYKGFIHAKTLVSDDKVSTIGSTNIDTRSFDLNFEINSVFYDEKLAVSHKDIFLEDIKNSEVASLQWFDSRFILLRGIWGFFKLFSPIL